MTTLIQTSAHHIGHKTTADFWLPKVAIIQWQQDRVNKLHWTNYVLRDRNTLLIDDIHTNTQHHHWKEFIIFFVQRFVRSVSLGYQFLITLGGYFMFVNVFVKNKSSESSPLENPTIWVLLENPTICFDKKCFSINMFLCKVNII